MKIALIHCPFEHRDFSENLRVVDEEFCLAPPIILAYVAAILEKAGHKVIIVDANALKLSMQDVLCRLKLFSPDLIGFRLDSYWFHRVVEWARFLKTHLKVKVIVGGVNLSLYPVESLSYECFDYGLIGEAVNSLPQLVERIGQGRVPVDVAGAVFRENNVVRVNPTDCPAPSFDSYPFPSRHLLPNRRYGSFTSQRKNYTIMVTSMGCLHNCVFCPIHRIPYRERSAGNVADEIEECIRKFDVREIDFFDADFFANKDRACQICNETLKRKLVFEWSCRARVDSVDYKVLRLAQEAGCKKIYYGIESSSQKVLDNTNKNIDYTLVKRVMELTRSCRIDTLGFFMAGSPGDTKESIYATMDFAKSLKLDFVQVCRTIAKPDTELNDMLIQRTGRDYWREYIAGRLAEGRFPSPWTDLSADELERYVKKFYNDFYFRAGSIARRIWKARSPEELFRYGKTAARWFFCNKSDTGP